MDTPGNLVDSPTHRYGESFLYPRIRSQCKGPRPKRFMQTDRQIDRQAGRQTDRQTDRKTDFEIFTSTVLYCSFLLYSKYSTYVVLNALYYILGGGGTLEAP